MTYASILYIRCSSCRHKWTMRGWDYLYNFMTRKCPSCGYLDYSNTSFSNLKEEQKNQPAKKGIYVEAVDY